MLPTFCTSNSGMYYLVQIGSDPTYYICYDGPAYSHGRGIFLKLWRISPKGKKIIIIDDMNNEVANQKRYAFLHEECMKSARSGLRAFIKSHYVF
jgi:hypothetical protein